MSGCGGLKSVRDMLILQNNWWHSYQDAQIKY